MTIEPETPEDRDDGQAVDNLCSLQMSVVLSANPLTWRFKQTDLDRELA